MVKDCRDCEFGNTGFQYRCCHQQNMEAEGKNLGGENIGDSRCPKFECVIYED